MFRKSLGSTFVSLRSRTTSPLPIPTTLCCTSPTKPSVLYHVRPFTSSTLHLERETRSRGTNDVIENPRNEKAKPNRNAFHGKTLLRRVAVGSDRSRTRIKNGRSKNGVTEVDSEEKLVTAYCAAEQYHMHDVARTLQGAGYALDPSQTGLFPQVVHVQMPPLAAHARETGTRGDVFVFPSGTVVAWDVEEPRMINLISKQLRSTAENSHLERMEKEDLQFVEDEESAKSSISGDKINLGMKFNPAVDLEESTALDASGSETQEIVYDEHAQTQHETNLTLVKIAFSSGIARSVKLAVLESALESYFRSTRSIPTLLSQGSKLPFTRSFILRKTGELLNARAQLNLNSELTDSLPDMFWDSRHELGLESYFDQIGKALDVNVRSRVLNQKMDYAQEIVSVLREQLSEKHGLSLEWLIIILISIEVAFEILNLWRDKLERDDPDSTESLLRRYLKSFSEDGQ